MPYVPDTVKTGVIQATKPSTRTELYRFISADLSTQRTLEDIKALTDPAISNKATGLLEGYGHKPFGSYQVDPSWNGAGTLS